MRILKRILRNLSICCCSNPNDYIICAYVNTYFTFCLAINYRNGCEPFRRKPLTALEPPPGLKTGVENDIFWSEMGSGFGEPGSITEYACPFC